MWVGLVDTSAHCLAGFVLLRCAGGARRVWVAACVSALSADHALLPCFAGDVQE